jgi:hypothetical protein
MDAKMTSNGKGAYVTPQGFDRSLALRAQAMQQFKPDALKSSDKLIIKFAGDANSMPSHSPIKNTFIGGLIHPEFTSARHDSSMPGVVCAGADESIMGQSPHAQALVQKYAAKHASITIGIPGVTAPNDAPKIPVQIKVGADIKWFKSNRSLGETPYAFFFLVSPPLPLPPLPTFFFPFSRLPF